MQEIEISDLKDNMHRKDAAISELTGKVNVLQDALTGRAAWDVLDRKMAEVLQVTADNRTEIRQLREMMTGKT